MKLGRQPKRHDPRTLQFRRYLTPSLPPPPTSRQWGQRIKSFPMYGNDVFGDCTVAAAGHMEQVWSSWGTPFLPTGPQILGMYWATGTQDDGRVMLDVLNYWRHTKLVHPIAAYAEVDPRDTVQVRQAINLFGGIYIGLNLPVEMQGRDHWSVVAGMRPGSWGGHAVNITAYTKSYLTCVTWGKRLRMSWPFWHACTDEAYAVLHRDFTPALPGYDFAALLADLAAI